MSRTRVGLVGIVAAGLMLMTAGAASAAPTVETEFDNIVVGNSWWLESSTKITTDVTSTSSSVSRDGEFSSYTSQIRQPINPDNTSTWPAKRGVIPVQFNLTASPTTETATTTTTTTAVTKVPSFKSIGSDNDPNNDWAALTTVPPAGTQVADITNLSSNYDWVTGNNHHGSLRWIINASGGPIWVHHGSYPNFNDNAAPGSGANLIAQSDLRFDASGRGGSPYNTWVDMQNDFGGETVSSIYLVIDAGAYGDQEINLNSATVGLQSVDSTVVLQDSYTGAPDVDLDHDGYDDAWVPGPSLVDETTGPWVAGPAGTPVQTNEPTAFIRVEKQATDTTPLDVMEPLSSAQGDTDGQFRQIDGKYIYNLKAETLGKGSFKVYMVIDNVKVLTSPGVFELR